MSVQHPKKIASPSKTSSHQKDLETLRKLWPFIWPVESPALRRRVVVALLALIFSKILTVLVPYLYKWAVDALTQSHTSFDSALMVVPIMLVLAYGSTKILAVVFAQLRDALFARVGQHAVRRLGTLSFVHLHQLSLRFHLEKRMGSLNRVIDRGVKGIETIVRFTILNTFPTVLEFALIAGAVWYSLGFIYTVIITGSLVLYVWFTMKASDWRIQIRQRMNNSDAEANAKSIDALMNYETVKYFCSEEREAQRFDESMARYEKAAIQTWTSLAWLNFGQTVIFAGALMACMVLSARAVLAGTQTVGDFVMVNALLIQLSIPLNFIGTVYREIRQGLEDIAALFDVMEVTPEIEDIPDAPSLQLREGAITFKNVCFSYRSGHPILKNISFSVPAGHMVAIVGPSGAGKSTLSRLIFRFYDVTQGKICIDGQDIRKVSQASLRACLGIVPQDTVLFNDSLGYNITYGALEGSDSVSLTKLEEAAKLAQLLDFVRTLPEGFATQVGERGLKLSGGEKQRVAIARTILKEPKILILDEATSALDSHTEHEIQTALDRVAENRTTLVIAHRLSTVVKADLILVLESGRIVERGTHASLLARNGLYTSLWNRQRAAEAAKEQLLQAESEEDFIHA